MKANKRSLALMLTLVLICTLLPLPAAQAADVQPVLSAALARQASAVPSPGYGDEWTVLGLARGGYFTAGSDYFARYYADLAAKAPELTAASGRDGALNAYKSTDNSRVILALSAIGRDAAQVGGCDLTAPYADFAWVANQGINGPIFALLALDSRNYLPGSAVRSRCVDAILSAECSGGGWALSGTAADPDVTAMALQALAAYRSEAAVAAAFRHTASGGVNSLATEQAVYALVAVSRLRRGQSSLYQETDTPTIETPAEPDASLARVLCTADGSGLIPAGYRTAAVCPPDASADSTVTFSDGTQLLYSPVLSERSGTPTWVWLFAPDVTDDMLNDPASYTVVDGKGPVLTVGDVNADGVINAQDALDIRTACAGETTPAADVLLAMDADLNGRVDAQDVRAVADSFVRDTALPAAQEDGT